MHLYFYCTKLKALAAKNKRREGVNSSQRVGHPCANVGKGHVLLNKKGGGINKYIYAHIERERERNMKKEKEQLKG